MEREPHTFFDMAYRINEGFAIRTTEQYYNKAVSILSLYQYIRKRKKSGRIEKLFLPALRISGGLYALTAAQTRT